MKHYIPTDDQDRNIIFQNLNSLDEKLACLSESRIAVIRELAKISSSNIEERDNIIDTLAKIYKETIPQKYTSEELDDFCIPDIIAKYINSISVIEKIEFCRNAINASKYNVKDLVDIMISDSELSSNESFNAETYGRVAYIKNNYTESAFLKFSKILSSPRAAYFSSFQAVCEEVYSGESEFCILPIESSSDGRLNSFYSMINRYELKIAATCTVEHSDTQNFTRFALHKKSIYALPSSKAFLKNRIFEFRFSASSDGISPLSDILCAAENCNMKLMRIDSFPLPYSDELLSYYVTFNIDRADLPTFLTYLTLEFPQCYPIGVYFSLK